MTCVFFISGSYVDWKRLTPHLFQISHFSYLNCIFTVSSVAHNSLTLSIIFRKDAGQAYIVYNYCATQKSAKRKMKNAKHDVKIKSF